MNMTPLRLAATCGNPLAVRMLLEAGADRGLRAPGLGGRAVDLARHGVERAKGTKEEKACLEVVWLLEGGDGKLEIDGINDPKRTEERLSRWLGGLGLWDSEDVR